MTLRLIARQLSRPTGFFGGIMGRLMNRHNARLNAFAVQHLEVTSADRVLEIGFGGGVNLPLFVARAAFLAGLDRSPDVVARAQSKYAAAVSAGRAEFREGNVEKIPFDAGSFTKVCTVNTIYFWRSLEAGFSEIHRVLSPGGRVVVGFVPKERMDRMKMPADIFTSRSPEDVIAAMRSVGFADARFEPPQQSAPWYAAIATR